MKKKLTGLVLVLLFALSSISVVQASYHVREPKVETGETVLSKCNSESGEVICLLPSIINMELEEALFGQFDTINPLEIGSESYTHFINNFVDRHNERVGNFRHDINKAMMTYDLIAPASICFFCGRQWRAPRAVTTWGSWWATGNSRVVGIFPHQRLEFEQRRTGVTDNIMNCCGAVLNSHMSSQTRWVASASYYD
jgi:hypothetical protein